MSTSSRSTRTSARDLSFSEAYDALRTAQKPKRGAPAYSRWVNRPVGRFMAAGAYRFGLVPNQVTAISAVATNAAIAAVALLRPSAAMSVVIALLLLLGYALDSADGQLARLTKLGRPSGEWLDHVIDMAKLCMIHGAVAVSWVRWGVPGHDWEGWAVGLPVLFLTASVVAFFGWLLAELLGRVARASSSSPAGDVSPAPPTETSAPALRSLLRIPSDYATLAITFAWFSTSFFGVTYILLLVANVMILLVALPTWFNQVREREEAGWTA